MKKQFATNPALVTWPRMVELIDSWGVLPCKPVVGPGEQLMAGGSHCWPDSHSRNILSQHIFCDWQARLCSLACVMGVISMQLGMLLYVNAESSEAAGPEEHSPPFLGPLCSPAFIFSLQEPPYRGWLASLCLGIPPTSCTDIPGTRGGDA